MTIKKYTSVLVEYEHGKGMLLCKHRPYFTYRSISLDIFKRIYHFWDTIVLSGMNIA